MAPEGCSATRCLARRARVVGALLASTASLAAAGPAKASRTQRKLAGYVMDDSTIRTAVAAWFDDRSGAEATYGPISRWETGGVTDMSWLFCVRQEWMDGESWYDDCGFRGCWESRPIAEYDSCVLPASASSFNEDIGEWAVHSVTDMGGMFWYASSFNQTLGWCVDDGVRLGAAFDFTPCESTSCGVKQGAGGCAPPIVDAARRLAGASPALLALALPLI